MAGSLVVINPHASKMREAAARDRLKLQLDAALRERDGSTPHIVETTAPGETEPIAQAALADGVRAVVGVGGDGTMREVASALQGSRVPVGLIPAGTGNQVAAVLGVPLSLEAAVSALGTGRVKTVDLGMVTLRLTGKPETTTISIIGCGAGFDARLMATTPSGLKQTIGKSAYFAQAVKLGLAIETDASIALVGNMGQVLPGIVDLRLPLDPTDGTFDVIVVAARGPVHGLKGLIDQLWRTRLGGASGADSIRLRGRETTIEPAEPEPLEVDGDYVGEGGLSARILPGALDVLVPPAT